MGYDYAEIARTIRALLRNGEIRDYDDEIANRLTEAAEICEELSRNEGPVQAK
jgi:hypothetical protein